MLSQNCSAGASLCYSSIFQDNGSVEILVDSQTTFTALQENFNQTWCPGGTGMPKEAAKSLNHFGKVTRTARSNWYYNAQKHYYDGILGKVMPESIIRYTEARLKSLPKEARTKECIRILTKKWYCGSYKKKTKDFK